MKSPSLKQADLEVSNFPAEVSKDQLQLTKKKQEKCTKYTTYKSQRPVVLITFNSKKYGIFFTWGPFKNLKF